MNAANVAAAATAAALAATVDYVITPIEIPQLTQLCRVFFLGRRYKDGKSGASAFNCEQNH